ncbi:TMV resistance N [Gossypium arboreum]|uniref:TMV resistance N n=1 Tax=Gossypium arboreum TaxID=29729 RepID=A0A0B0MTJ9_GOSAR|nr:TMV resistance N [Gossypium arboreum]
MAPMLPSLSGLCSLRELNLRDCSLCEGDIPSDISGLSSLEFLDLKGNNFISIPASIIRLSKLNYIRLSDCKMLKSLPELPTSTEDVWIDGCSSLEVVSSPSKVCNLSDSAYITAINCYNLAENDNALTLLKKHLKAFANSRKRFFVIIPGNEIPEWFSQQRGGSVIEIPLPLNIQNDSQWIGVAVCCIFVNDSASGDKIFGCKANILISIVKLQDNLAVKILERNPRQIERRGWLVGKRFNKPIMKEITFFFVIGHVINYIHFPWRINMVAVKPII